jgi:hypothetical protein
VVGWCASSRMGVRCGPVKLDQLLVHNFIIIINHIVLCIIIIIIIIISSSIIIINVAVNGPVIGLR